MNMRKTLFTSLIALTMTSVLAVPIKDTLVNDINTPTRTYYSSDHYNENAPGKTNANRGTFNDGNYNYPHYDNSAGFEPLLAFGFIAAFITLISRMFNND